METTVKKLVPLLLIVLSLGFLQSCNNKEPSVVKVYVRSESNMPVIGAKVIIIGDVDSNPPTNSYVDTVVTNDSGFAYFNVQPHFDDGDKDYTVAYFDIIAKLDTKVATGTIRSRVHTTAVETVYFPM